MNDDRYAPSNDQPTQVRKSESTQRYPPPFLSNETVDLSPTTQPSSSTGPSDISEARTQLKAQRASVEHNPVYFMDPLYMKDRPAPILTDHDDQLNLEASLNRALLVHGTPRESDPEFGEGIQVLASYTKIGFDVLTLGPKMIVKPPFLVEVAPRGVSNAERWWPAWSHGGPGGWR